MEMEAEVHGDENDRSLLDGLGIGGVLLDGVCLRCGAMHSYRTKGQNTYRVRADAHDDDHDVCDCHHRDRRVTTSF